MSTNDPGRTTARDPWIRARDLCFGYGAHQVLREVAFDLRPGRHYIIAGPNGAGKSTLLDLLANLKTPQSGTLEIMGAPVAERRPGALARTVALAPQEEPMRFAFTVREAVAMGRRPHLGRWGALGVGDREAVDRALCELHIEALADKPVTALSGGERRRVVVARTLAQETPIILLDEPSAGLDIAQALSLMALARRLAQAGRLVATVSHDLNLAAAFGDELLFLRQGRVAAFGPVETVFTDEVLSRIYQTAARVRRDDFTGAPAVSFRLDRAGGTG